MSMSYIWIGLLSASVVSALVTGQTAALSAAAVAGAQEGVTLSIGMAGAICLWSALMKAAAQAGLTEKLAVLLRPLLSRLFPETSRDSGAMAALTANLAANLLGLGNAATPLGIDAIRRMKTLSGGATSDEMCLLVVLNTASLQLIPSTVAALRASLGAARPFDILPAVWLSAAVSVSCGVLTAKLLAKRWRR